MKPLKRSILVTAFALLPFTPIFGASYFVDGDAGSDEASGLDPVQAWCTLDKVNAQVFQPGDTISFKAGTHYRGRLAPQGSGRDSAPILLDSYGNGPKPRIDGDGNSEALVLRNVEFWEVRDLEVTNLGLIGLEVHDVNGDLR